MSFDVLPDIFRRLQNSTNSYIPHNKEWIKEKIYEMLKKQAGPGRR